MENNSHSLDFGQIQGKSTEKKNVNKESEASLSNLAETAKFANFAKVQSMDESNVKDDEELPIDILKSTPLIPQSVYDNLPPILLESSKVITNPRERDAFLTAALAILSGCLPNVTGTYHGRTVYPNLFSFVLAPAASGKGVLVHAKSLADKYHERTISKSLVDKKEYTEKVNANNRNKDKSQLDFDPNAIVEPQFKVVFIPANTSNAKIIQHLDNNQGRGIICETEADTLGQTFKKEWGSYSDMLRKAFHHEKISISRKTDGEFIEVNNPQLSVALSGTPKQIYNIIASAEDGLFSRFLYYIFESEVIWMDPSPKGNPINLTNFFSKQSEEVLKMVEYFEKNEMELLLTDEQWEKLNSIFSIYLTRVSNLISDDALSVVKRLSLIVYRFCMVFTAIRKFSSKGTDKDVFCSDTDFQSALELAEVYLQHSILLFSNLPKQSGQDVFKYGNNKLKFLDALPNRFYRKDVIVLAKEHSMSTRTLDEFLNASQGKYLNKIKSGLYEKI